MSKQGEEYERFVQDVYKILNTNDGLNDVVVQHNVKLKGLSREHQIDVYWQFSVGKVIYRVAVECKDYKNPVTAEKIEAFRATLLDIGNICGIFASRNGFQSGAEKVAKAYGIQLMQIREPLASDWKGYIKDIYIDYIFRFVRNVRPEIIVDSEWVKENGIKESLHFSGKSDQAFVILNKGLPTEQKESLYEIIKKLPSKEKATDQIYIVRYENAFFECGDRYIKIKEIKFLYDVEFSYDQQHIDAMNIVKAIVRNVISGEATLIDIRNNVRDFMMKN